MKNENLVLNKCDEDIPLSKHVINQWLRLRNYYTYWTIPMPDISLIYRLGAYQSIQAWADLNCAQPMRSKYSNIEVSTLKVRDILQ